MITAALQNVSGSGHDLPTTDESANKTPPAGIIAHAIIRRLSNVDALQAPWDTITTQARWPEVEMPIPTTVKTLGSLTPGSAYLFVDLLKQRPDQTASIGDFPGEPYRTLKPIPVTLHWTGTEYLARFEEANIAMTGETCSEAIDNLTADILDTFEDYSAEAALGPAPRHQLAVLRRHIARR
jgi:hypothetical protein